MVSTSRQIVVAVVVALLVSLGVVIYFGNSVSSGPTAGSGGNVSTNIDTNVNGVGIGAGPQTGADIFIAGRVIIPAGTNQVAWKNKTGRSVIIEPTSTGIGYSSGIASSSLNFYVGTSTASTFTDYARPTPTRLVIDGVNIATSSPAGAFYMGTSSATYNRGFIVPDGGYLVFDIQEKHACKSVGVCETATSTNRGITSFFGFFQGHYAP